MKRILLLACLLSGCTSQPTSPPLPVALKSLRATAVNSFVTESAQVQEPVRDVFVVGDPLLWGTWNGVAFDMPVKRSWLKLKLANPTSANLVKLDTTTDLKFWTLVGYFTNCPNGILVLDTDSTNRYRFYRLSVVP
jgi:hypothetical protein